MNLGEYSDGETRVIDDLNCLFGHSKKVLVIF